MARSLYDGPLLRGVFAVAIAALVAHVLYVGLISGTVKTTFPIAAGEYRASGLGANAEYCAERTISLLPEENPYRFSFWLSVGDLHTAPRARYSLSLTDDEGRKPFEESGLLGNWQEAQQHAAEHNFYSFRVKNAGKFAVRTCLNSVLRDGLIESVLKANIRVAEYNLPLISGVIILILVTLPSIIVHQTKLKRRA